MTPLADLVGRLQVVLGAEEDAYLRLKSVLRREEEELVALEPAALEITTGEKRALASEARLHEQARVEITRGLASLLGFEGVPRLSELIAALAEDANDLPERHARLSALIQSTRDLLASNERFADRSLSRVQRTLKLLGQAVPESSTYGPGSPREAQTSRGRLVRAAI